MLDAMQNGFRPMVILEGNYDRSGNLGTIAGCG